MSEETRHGCKMRPPISHDGSDQFMRKGTWTPEEDDLLIGYIRRYGIWNWTEMPKAAGNNNNIVGN